MLSCFSRTFLAVQPFLFDTLWLFKGDKAAALALAAFFPFEPGTSRRS